MLSMDGNEFSQWKDFYAVCPFGPIRGDLQAGIVRQAVYAAAGAKKLPPIMDAVLKFRRAKPKAKAIAHKEVEDHDAALAAIAAESGIPFTPGPGLTDAAD